MIEQVNYDDDEGYNTGRKTENERAGVKEIMVSIRGVVGMMLWQVCKLDSRCLFLYLEANTPSVHTPHTRSFTAFLFPFSRCRSQALSHVCPEV